jgi:hypothetical protein
MVTLPPWPVSTDFGTLLFIIIIIIIPIPVAARYKTLVCGHSLAWIGGSILSDHMDACLL